MNSRKLRKVEWTSNKISLTNKKSGNLSSSKMLRQKLLDRDKKLENIEKIVNSKPLKSIKDTRNLRIQKLKRIKFFKVTNPKIFPGRKCIPIKEPRNTSNKKIFLMRKITHTSQYIRIQCSMRKKREQTAEQDLGKAIDQDQISKWFQADLEVDIVEQVKEAEKEVEKYLKEIDNLILSLLLRRALQQLVTQNNHLPWRDQFSQALFLNQDLLRKKIQEVSLAELNWTIHLVIILQICLINSKIDQTKFHSTILNHLRLKNQSAFSKLN